MLFQTLKKASEGSRCKSDSVSCLPAPWCKRVSDENGCRTCQCNSKIKSAIPSEIEREREREREREEGEE